MKISNVFVYVIGGTFLLNSQFVYSQDNTNLELASADSEELMFLALLEEQTEIATKTRINADFVPGMVTVLPGNKMENRGIHTVWQALGTVPGMEATIDQIGSRIVKVRGIGGSFASGNLKIMVNNIAMNSGLSALAQPVMNMPMVQVDRIEIIRGPGSAVHGEFAYAGVVNVITKKGQNGVFAEVGENELGMIGGIFHWQDNKQQINLDLNVAFSETDGSDPFVESDGLFLTGAAIGMSQAGVSKAPGEVSEGRGYKSVLFNLNFHDYNIKAQWLNDDHEAHFGTLNVLPDNKDYYDNEFKTLELSKSFDWNEEISSNLQVGWLEYINEYDAEILPEGFGLWHYPSFPLTLDNGFLVDGYYKEAKFYLGVDTFWKITSEHNLMLAFNYSRSKVKDSWQELNIHPNILISPADDYPIAEQQKFSGADPINWPKNGTKRELTSFTLQDEYRPSDKLSITAGIRYDHYSDVGSNLSPRLAAVYNFNQQHLFKAQYAQAFRPPTFYETTWTPDLDPQTIDTIDLGYVYKGTQYGLKLTLFHSKLKDLITAINPLGFSNAEGAKVYGAELEIDYQINNEFAVNANASYAKSKDDETNEAIPRTTDWLSNIMFLYQPSSQYDMSLHYQYIGDHHREPDDPREDLDGYGVVNLTFTIKDLLSKGSTIQLGIDNAFNQDIRYPSQMVTDILGSSFPSYEDDYPRNGRYFWLKLKYQFN